MQYVGKIADKDWSVEDVLECWLSVCVCVCVCVCVRARAVKREDGLSACVLVLFSVSQSQCLLFS